MRSPHPNYHRTICFMEVQATAFLFDRLFIQGLLLTFGSDHSRRYRYKVEHNEEQFDRLSGLYPE